MATDMTALSQFVGGGATAPTDKPPIGILGRNVLMPNLASVPAFFDATNSGALTADVYKDVLVLNAPGVLKLCVLRPLDATARTVGLRITIDGVVVYDASAATSSSNTGLMPVGVAHSANFASLDRVPFSTLSIAVKSSLAETDKVQTCIAYDLVQP
jgi:hypothetical protein